MGYASRSGRHDNAAAAPGRISREDRIQAKAFMLQRLESKLVAGIIAGGERAFVEAAMWANQDGFSRAENEEVFRRICRGSILAEGADPADGLLIQPCQS